MRTQLHRILGTLSAGRHPVAVVTDIARASALAIILWISACAFLLMEPLS